MSTANTSDGGGGLRERRKTAGLSQLEVAQLAGCSPAMVGLLDRGYRPHRSAVLERVEAVLNADARPGQKSRAASRTRGTNVQRKAPAPPVKPLPSWSEALLAEIDAGLARLPGLRATSPSDAERLTQHLRALIAGGIERAEKRLVQIDERKRELMRASIAPSIQRGRPGVSHVPLPCGARRRASHGNRPGHRRVRSRRGPPDDDDGPGPASGPDGRLR